MDWPNGQAVLGIAILYTGSYGWQATTLDRRHGLSPTATADAAHPGGGIPYPAHPTGRVMRESVMASTESRIRPCGPTAQLVAQRQPIPIQPNPCPCVAQGREDP